MVILWGQACVEFPSFDDEHKLDLLYSANF